MGTPLEIIFDWHVAPLAKDDRHFNIADILEQFHILPVIFYVIFVTTEFKSIFRHALCLEFGYKCK